MVKQRSERDRRLSRLSEDLRTLGVRDPLAPRFADEVIYALYPPVHERRVATYAAITTAPYAEIVGEWQVVRPRLPLESARLSLVWSTADVRMARQAADGRYTAVNIDGLEGVDVVRVAGGTDEIQMVALQQELGYSAVQRTSGDRVRLFLPEQILTFETNSWSAKRYSHQMIWPLATAGPRQVLETLMALVVHHLSASNVGATLVWCTSSFGSPGTLRSSNGLGGSPVSVDPLSIFDHGSSDVIRSLCSQNDRALAFDAFGNLLQVGVELLWDPAQVHPQVHGGTRHNSASRASGADPSLVVFVVSEDGPVSVFHDGHRVTSFETGEIAVRCSRCRGTGRTSKSNDTLVPPAWLASPGVSDEDNCERCAGEGRVWLSRPIVSRTRPR